MMAENKIVEQYYGNHVVVTSRDEECTIYRLEDATGCAVLTRYQVFPGIVLVYNDVHRQEVSVECKDEICHIFEINHCREGRIEFETAIGEYMYIKKGDMAINKKGSVQNYSYFPLCHYHGVTIEMDFKVLEKEIPNMMRELHINLNSINNKFNTEKQCFIFRENEQFEHLFAELYCVPEMIRKEYYKIKVIEILLFMSVLKVNNKIIENKYYNKNQVAVVKEIRDYLIQNLEEKITIDQLAGIYNMSPTNIKKYFRAVYGNSIYAYIKEYRIKKAAEMLRASKKEIAVIAGMVGYDNPSKFAESFRSVMGINPSEYKKSV